MYNTLEVVILKKRLLQFIDQLVLISDITFVKVILNLLLLKPI